MDKREYREQLVSKIEPLMLKGESAGDISRHLKIGIDYTRQLMAIIAAKEAGVPEEKIIGSEEIPKKEIILTTEQEEIILHAWNVDKIDSLKEIVQRVFGSDFDGRTNEAKAIKKFLATRQLKARPSQIPVTKMSKIVFDDTQQEFIKNHSTLLSPLEIAQSLFGNPLMTPLSAEARAVREHMKAFLPPENFRTGKVSSEHKEVTGEYRPPKSIHELIKRVNSYVSEELNFEKLNPRQKHNLNCLMHYLHVHRFQMMMNEFVDERDRDMMESSFIRWLYDKGDLTEEEIDLYINWVLDVVNHSKMYRELNKLILFRDNVMDTHGTMSKPLVDQINKLYEEIDSSQKRQKAAQNDLSGKRRDRVENAGKNNQSVVQLVEGFKDHKKRQLIVQFAESRKKVVGNEIERLTTMDDLKFELFGATKEEILHGL